jgi:ABC-type polar amino acid transport system ATPase subunit
MVFQRFSLYPHMTVMKNVTLALRTVQKLSRADAEARAISALENVGLGNYTRRYPNELSGGQQQRAAIARALVLTPDVLLLDEPTSALDPETTREVLDVLRKLRMQGMTQVLVTHEMRFAKEAADEVVLIEDGRVAEHSDSATFFSDSASKRASQFIGN